MEGVRRDGPEMKQTLGESERMRLAIVVGLVLLTGCYPDVPTVNVEVDERNLRYRVHVLSSATDELVYSDECFMTSSERNPRGFSLVFQDSAGEVVRVYGYSEWVPFTIDSNFYPARDQPNQSIAARTRVSSDWYPLQGAVVGAMPYSDYSRWRQMRVQFRVHTGQDLRQYLDAESL
jgi:hypothetical protein